MTLHSRLICGDQEWVLSIIGSFDKHIQQDVKSLYSGLVKQPTCCTVDFSKATVAAHQAMSILVMLQQYVSAIQITGCNQQLLMQLQQQANPLHSNICFL